MGAPFVSPLLSTIQEQSIHPLYRIYKEFLEILPNSAALYLGTKSPPPPYNWQTTKHLYFNFRIQAVLETQKGHYGLVVIEALEEKEQKRMEDLMRYANRFLANGGFMVIYDKSTQKIVRTIRGVTNPRHFTLVRRPSRRDPHFPYPIHTSLYKLLKVFAEMEHIDFHALGKEKMLVLGHDRVTNGLVNHLRKEGFNVFGVEPEEVFVPNYVRGEFTELPFKDKVFHAVFALDFLHRFSDLAFPSNTLHRNYLTLVFSNVWHAMKYNGYLLVGLDPDRVAHEILENIGFERLPFNLESISIYRKSIDELERAKRRAQAVLAKSA